MTWVEEIENMDMWQKLSVFMHYHVTQLTLKYNFEIVDKRPLFSGLPWNHGWGKPTIEMKNFALYKGYPNCAAKKFEQFISPSNIEVTDNGEDWEAKGVYAQRYRTDYTGIYDWWPKFKNEIKL